MVAGIKPKIVFLTGYGRSGSTILDITLAQNPDIFGAGEITALTRHVWQENEYCACGNEIRSCPVWGEVVSRWLEGRDEGAVERYHRLQRRFEAAFSPFLIASGLAGRLGFAEYREMTESLFRTIAAVSGKDIVLDSSKLPGRAFALSKLPGIELALIHLVRDGRAVAWSMTQSFDRDVKAGFQKVIRPKSVLRTAMRWTLVNLMAEYACRRLAPERCCHVSYEGFTADPQATLERVGARLGLDFSQTARTIARNEPLSPAHQMAGSRIRMKQSMVLSADSSWRAVMPAESQARVRRLCGWLLRRYGYL